MAKKKTDDKINLDSILFTRGKFDCPAGMAVNQFSFF